MRKWELIKQSKQLKIKSQILSNLFNEKYGLKLEEFNNTTGTERVKLLTLKLWQPSCRFGALEVQNVNYLLQIRLMNKNQQMSK